MPMLQEIHALILHNDHFRDETKQGKKIIHIHHLVESYMKVPKMFTLSSSNQQNQKN